MKLNPYRPYRPATCSGKRAQPEVLRKRARESVWSNWMVRLRNRKAIQKEKREKRGYALLPGQR